MSEVIVLAPGQIGKLLNGKQVSPHHLRLEFSKQEVSVSDAEVTVLAKARLANNLWQYALEDQLNPYNAAANGWGIGFLFGRRMIADRNTFSLPNSGGFYVIADDALSPIKISSKGKIPVVGNSALVSAIQNEFRSLRGSETSQAWHIAFDVDARCWVLRQAQSAAAYYRFSTSSHSPSSKNALNASSSQDSILCVGDHRIPLSELKRYGTQNGKVILVDAKSREVFELSPVG